MATTSTNQRGMRVRTVMPFFALSFGLTWGIAALLILFPNPIVAIFGELNYTNPVYILAVYAPESSALSWFGATSAAVVIVWLNRKTRFAREGAQQ